MKNRFISISTKLLVPVIVWLIGAVSFTGITLKLSWELENGGVVINDAGSLRKNIYYMATLANYPGQQNAIQQTQTRFEEALTRLENFNVHWATDESTQLQQQIQNIRSTSRTVISEFIKATNSGEGLNIEQLHHVNRFVDDIDTFIKNIEIGNTQNISMLRWLQLFLVCMVILSAIVATVFLKRWVITPLGLLSSGIQKVSQGDLTVQTQVINNDEFGQVATGFNKMAENLHDLYENLEQKVDEKTLALEEKNHQLMLLYEVTAFLHESQTQENMVTGFLKYVTDISHAQAGSIRILDKKQKKLDYVCSIGLPEDYIESESETHLREILRGIDMHRSNIVIHNKVQPDNTDGKTPLYNHCTIFYIRHGSHNIGIVSLYFNQNEELKKQNTNLIETLVNQLGVALENQRLASIDKQFAIVEERNLMAQGLHDSIAQSLSFLNLQVQMLESAMQKNDQVHAQENLKFIQDGVHESYENVRELLLNFRTKIEKEDFPKTIQSVITRFEKQAKIPVQLSGSGINTELTMEQQLQVVFILQEAFSNIRKHAQAQHVTVEIKNGQDFIMKISDDGVGFGLEQTQSKKDRHVGLGIMHERALRAGGEVKVVSEHNKGTQLTLVIPYQKRTLNDKIQNIID